MAEQDAAPGVDLYQVAHIVSSYVRHHQLGPDQLVGLIVEVHQALANLSRGAPPVQEPRKPAVPIRRSVQQDCVVCLECGYRAQTLRRHLRVAHDLEDADYRTRWKLTADHPLIAPSYSARRSRIAKEIARAPRRRTEPVDNRAARDPAWRSPDSAPTGDITPTVLRAPSVISRVAKPAGTRIAVRSA